MYAIKPKRENSYKTHINTECCHCIECFGNVKCNKWYFSVSKTCLAKFQMIKKKNIFIKKTYTKTKQSAYETIIKFVFCFIYRVFDICGFHTSFLLFGRSGIRTHGTCVRQFSRLRPSTTQTPVLGAGVGFEPTMFRL